MDVAFQHAAELQRKNTVLIKRFSQLDIEKKREIDELTKHLKELQCAVEISEKDITDKNKKIAEKKAIIKKLADKKQDGSSELAKALHEKEAEIEQLRQQLQTEVEKRNESEQYNNQLSDELKAAKFELGDGFVDVSFDTDSIEDSGAVGNTIHTPPDRELRVPSGVAIKETESVMVQTEVSELSTALDKIQQLEEKVKNKERQLVNLESQLKECSDKVFKMEQVQDHSKSQSKAMLNVKQELDATKVSVIKSHAAWR